MSKEEKQELMMIIQFGRKSPLAFEKKCLLRAKRCGIEKLERFILTLAGCGEYKLAQRIMGQESFRLNTLALG